MGNEIKTRGHSDQDLSVDSSKFYENYWEEAKEISALTLSKNKALLNHFFPDRPKEKKILEIGVGGEGGMLLLLKNDNQVNGIDVSSSAQRNCELFGLKIDVLNVDTQGIPFTNEYFDIVFAFEVFEHFANPQFVAEEIRRVLKKEGIFLLSTPNPYIHHWPRLFYPGLFEEQAFREFLMINEFKIGAKGNLGTNLYQNSIKDDSEKAFNWCWYCEKIEDNPDIFFEHGLYFWKQSNPCGIKTRPIEAIDMFRKSLEIAGPENIKSRFFLALSLRYRLIYNETEEFMTHVDWFMNQAQIDQYPQNMKSIFVLLMLYYETKKFGLEIFDFESSEAIRQGLHRFPGSDPYIKTLNDFESGKINNDDILNCLE
jgi:SAM-dependent methyltransferase